MMTIISILLNINGINIIIYDYIKSSHTINRVIRGAEKRQFHYFVRILHRVTSIDLKCIVIAF